jgi:aryl-alcohol dehydrogenase-like predicted oxidoreductase
MRYVERDGGSASVLGFGCGAVLGRVGRGDSLRAMGAAWDAGITLFDTARSYGYGEAEGLLGEFLAGKRDKAVISTKFGIWPERQQGWKQFAKPLVRGLLKLAPGARSLVRRGAAGEITANQFTVKILRDSLEESLRRLRTDYVDVLFLHDAPSSVLGQDELFAELERVVAEGKVRRVGISTEPAIVGMAMERGLPVVGAFQFPANVFDLAVTEFTRRAAGRYFCVANHPFGGVMGVAESKRVVAEMAQDVALPESLREKLADGSNLLLADVVFSVILRGTGIDVVVPAMMRVENLLTNVKACSESRFTEDEAGLLRGRFLGVR